MRYEAGVAWIMQRAALDALPYTIYDAAPSTACVGQAACVVRIASNKLRNLCEMNVEKD